jgi:hypothetical protein
VGQRHSSSSTNDHSRRYPGLGLAWQCALSRRRARSDQRETLPALIQDAQTFSRLGVPDTTACTRWMLGFQRRLVFFFDQGTLWPNPGLLPHMSHTAATGIRSQITSIQMKCPKLGNLKRVPDQPQHRPIAAESGIG